MPAAPTRWQKGLYGVLTIGGRYGWTKWEDWLADRDGGYEEVLRDSPLCVFKSALTVSSQVQMFDCSPEYPLSPQRPIQLQLLLRSLFSWSMADTELYSTVSYVSVLLLPAAK